MKRQLETEPTIEISVLMPVHNGAATITAAVGSTLSAMPLESELLVILDNCTDNTKYLLEEVNDQRLRIFHSAEQLGVAKALNLLLANARGTYVARMDADDICLPWRFRRQSMILSRTKADIVFGNAILFGSGIRPFLHVPQLPIRIQSEVAALSLLNFNPFVHPTMFAKTGALRQLGGYSSSAAEDYELWMRASLSGFKIFRSAGYQIMYRVHGSQLTQQETWKEKFANDSVLQSTKRQLAISLFGEAGNTDSASNLQELTFDALVAMRAANITTILSFFGVKKLIKMAHKKAKAVSCR